MFVFSCEQEDIDVCDCDKVTYQVENRRWFNEEGLPRRVELEIELNRESVGCQIEEQRVYIRRNDTDYHNIYYDIVCQDKELAGNKAKRL